MKYLRHNYILLFVYTNNDNGDNRPFRSSQYFKSIMIFQYEAVTKQKMQNVIFITKKYRRQIIREQIPNNLKTFILNILKKNVCNVQNYFILILWHYFLVILMLLNDTEATTIVAMRLDEVSNINMFFQKSVDFE